MFTLKQKHQIVQFISNHLFMRVTELVKFMLNIYRLVKRLTKANGHHIHQRFTMELHVLIGMGFRFQQVIQKL